MPEIIELSSAEACFALMGYLYGDRWLNIPGNDAIRLCAAIAKMVPVCRVWLPDGLNTLKKTAGALIEDASSKKKRWRIDPMGTSRKSSRFYTGMKVMCEADPRYLISAENQWEYNAIFMSKCHRLSRSRYWQMCAGNPLPSVLVCSTAFWPCGYLLKSRQFQMLLCHFCSTLSYFLIYFENTYHDNRIKYRFGCTSLHPTAEIFS